MIEKAHQWITEYPLTTQWKGKDFKMKIREFDTAAFSLKTAERCAVSSSQASHVSVDTVDAVDAGQEDIAVDAKVVGSSLEDSLKSGNPWAITDIARKILSYCGFKDLRATATVSTELRAASEEAKRDLVISLNEWASREYLRNPA